MFCNTHALIASAFHKATAKPYPEALETAARMQRSRPVSHQRRRDASSVAATAPSANQLSNACPLPAGVSKNETPYEGQVRRGQIKREAHREARAKHIEECMAKMPDLIEEYRASRRVKWEDVSAADKMLLNAKQIRFKYVYKRMMNK